MKGRCTTKDLRKKHGIGISAIRSLITKNLVKSENGVIDKSESEILDLLKCHTNSVIPEKMPLVDDFVSIGDICKIRNIHPQTIRRWAKVKKIKIYKFFSETNEFVRKSEIDKIKKGEWNEQSDESK